ncbi:MAG: SUMF1/EgtB/PvdO family nonheme iron enzyme, partial [Candidatus Marinimicrobia bacterium]|nr:SUMF1/EgtB/PvdO family nonheme iron enzyme [Candidatus Neomarinimicrobiota bacterium]
NWSTSSSLTTLSITPPTSVSALAVTDASITITWNDNCAFEDGYILEEDAGSGYNEIADLATNTTSYTQTSLSLNTEYTYRVIAYTNSNQADPIYTTALETEFPVPSALSAIPIANDEVELNWTDNTSFETGFKIERAEGAGFVQIGLVGENVTTYTNAGLSSGMLYTYRIRAYTADNNSEYSSEVSSGYVIVPAGPYAYGNDNPVSINTDLDEDFLMMHYEVTNAQYASYLTAAMGAGDFTLVNTNTVEGPYDGANDAHFGAGNYEYIDLNDAAGGHIFYNTGSFYVHSGYEDHPVTEVTWFGADAFADYYGLRLPTEFEWEKAARGDLAYNYPWGNDGPTCELANFSGCAGETQAVGLATGASPFGILDLAGNVWEWTANYDGATTERVLRGGSYSNAATSLQTWYRYSSGPENASANVGFRCVINN